MNITSRRFLTSSLCCILFYSAATAQLSLNSGVRILSPRFFPGWQAQNVAFPFVFYDSTAHHYKMYYAGSSSTQVNESTWDQWVTGVVTSSDALNWQYPDSYEPVLFAKKFMEGEVVDPPGQSNRFDAIFAIDAFVIKDGSVYKCWYTGWNGDFTHTGNGLSKKINYRIGYATSTDGYNWTKLSGKAGLGAILGTGGNQEADSHGAEDPYIIKENGIYKMWYTGYDGQKRRILYATSANGIDWTKKGVVMNLHSKGDDDGPGTQSPVVIKRNDQYELWYQQEKAAAQGFHTMRAISKDGNSWKTSGEVLLHPSLPVPTWTWTSYTSTGTEKTVLGNIIVHKDQSCQLFYSRQFTGERKLTYGVVRTPISFIYSERLNP